MAGIRLTPEESADLIQNQQLHQLHREIGSDDERSVAADSWSIKSEYGSNFDDDQRHVDAAEALSSAANFRAASDYSSDKDDSDTEQTDSMLGLQSYWDAAYADELSNFREHGHAGEVWFGADVMDVVASWTKSLCIDISQGRMPNHVDATKSELVKEDDKYLSHWSVLDIGTGNGLLLQELAKQGFSDLTGTDYSEGAIDLARSLADRDGFSNLKFLVDDILETRVERQFQLVTDKGTLDAIGLHPDGAAKRVMYWDSVAKLVASRGLLVITSCNNTKDELMQEVENFNQRWIETMQDPNTPKDQVISMEPPFQYLNHVRTYPTFTFGGSVGSRVATVAFIRK